MQKLKLFLSGSLPQEVGIEEDEPLDYKNIKDKYDKTGLHYAAYLGYEDITEYFVHNGFNINSIDNLERTPLHYAAITGDWVDLLIKLKAEHLAQDKLYRTPCHLAVMNNNIDAVRTFLNKERRIVKAKDSFGRTILHYSASSDGNTFQIAELIWKYQTNLNEKDEDGKTAIFYACK